MAAFILKRCADEKKRVPRAFLPLCFTFTYSQYIDKGNKVKWGGGGAFSFRQQYLNKEWFSYSDN